MELKMLNKQFVEDTIKQLIEGCFSDPTRVLEDYKGEMSNMAEYRGREILELVQNAVDELTEEKRNIRIEFNTKDKILRVCNNGNVFTESGFTALMYSRISPKFENDDYIGNKGTGFKSILNWADQIKIFSGELAVLFSKQVAQETFNSLLGEKYFGQNKKLKEIYQPDGENEVATLKFPKCIQPQKNEFDTTIEIKIKDEYVEDVKKQINLINSKTILFLKKLQKMEIDVDGEKVLFEKNEKIKDKLQKIQEVTIDRNGEKISWLVLSKKGIVQAEGKEKSFSISVAYNEKEVRDNNTLYCFFKTSVELPIGLVVHATVDLDGGREHLLNKPHNDIILQEIFSLSLNLAKYINQNKVDYGIIDLIRLRGNFDSYFTEKGLDKKYYDLLKSDEIFPTVNNEYISLKDVRFYSTTKSRHCPWSQVVCGIGFENLLQLAENEEIDKFMLKLLDGYERAYYYQSLCEKVNQNVDNYKNDISRMAKLCKFFIQDFETDLKNSLRPNIVLDEQNNLIGKDRVVFIQPAKEDVQLPTFAKISYTSKELTNKLKEEFNITDVVNLAQKLNPLNIKRYDIDELVRNVFEELKKHKTNQFEENKQAIIWLFQLNKSKSIDWVKTRDVITLPTSNKGVKLAKTLYFNSTYDEEMMEKLVGDKDCYVLNFDEFGLPDEEKSSFKFLLTQLGVAKTPRVVQKEVYDIEWCKEKSKISDLKQLSVLSYEYLDEVLTRADTTDIIKWIFEDSKLKANIELKTRNEGYKKPHYTNFKYDLELPAYLNHVFTNSRWIEINGKRYSPQQCTTKNVGESLEPFLYEINLNKYLPKNSALMKDEVMFFLRKLGLIDDFWKIDSERLYAILLLLSNRNKVGDDKQTKKIYNAILEEATYHEYIMNNLVEYGKNRKDFLEQGKVYCKSGKFVEIKDVRYMSQINPSKTLIQQELIDIPTRKSGKFIKEFLGVEALQIEYEFNGCIRAEVNQLFQKDFEQFKNLAWLYRKDDARNTELNNIKNLRIELCTKVNIVSNGITACLDEFSYVENDKTIYLCVQEYQDLVELKNDINFAETISNIFLDIMKIQETNRSLSAELRNLYQKNSEQRLKSVAIDFPDYDILQEESQRVHEKQKALSLLFGDNIYEETAQKLEKINYSNISCFDNIKVFEEIMDDLKLSPAEFNQKTGYNVDFEEYYNDKISKYIQLNENNFKNLLLEYYHQTDYEIKDYKKHYEDFIECRLTDVEKPILDVEMYMKTKFPILKNPMPMINANEVYTKHRNEFEAKNLSSCDEATIRKFFNNNEHDSFLYFDEQQELQKMFEEFVEKEREKAERFNEVLTKPNEQTYEIEHIETESVKNHSYQNGHSAKKERKHRPRNRAHDRDNEAWGAKAEEIVFDSMKLHPETYQNLKWVSENAFKAKGDKRNPDGREGLGYDIIYYNENNEPIYVEVKSTNGTKIEFEISNNEIEFAERNKSNYKVIFVSDIESKCKISDLGFLFDYEEGKTKFTTEKFTISVDNYIITCKKK